MARINSSISELNVKAPSFFSMSKCLDEMLTLRSYESVILICCEAFDWCYLLC